MFSPKRIPNYRFRCPRCGYEGEITMVRAQIKEYSVVVELDREGYPEVELDDSVMDYSETVSRYCCPQCDFYVPCGEASLPYIQFVPNGMRNGRDR